MENNNNNHNNHGMGNGFFLGVIVGVIVALLFSTKKGREILKDMTERGLEKFSDLEKQFEQKEEDIEELDGNDYVKPDQEPSAASPAPAKREVRYLADSGESKGSAKATPPEEISESNGSSAPKKKRIIPKFFSRGAKKN